jgi:hypothetical protein
VLVTLNWVEMTPYGRHDFGQGAGACVKGADGRVVTATLPRDWNEPQP